MPWARWDDQANTNPKLLALSNGAWRLFGCGLIYAQQHLTDGFIPAASPNAFGVRGPLKPLIDELCSVLVPGKQPLWHRVDGGYQINDYLDWNDSRDEILAKRSRGKDRLDRYRERKRTGNASRNALQPPLRNALRTPFVTPPETGGVTTDPRTTYHEDQNQDQDQRGSRRAVCGNPVENSAVLLRLAHSLLDDLDAGAFEARDATDLNEEFKTRAARARIAYDAIAIGKALDQAERQRGARVPA